MNGFMAPRRKAKIRERKLGRERAMGQSWADGDRGHIEIDPRIRGERTRLSVLLHELLHLVAPDWGEKKVEESAQYIARALWLENYRRVRN